VVSEDSPRPCFAGHIEGYGRLPVGLATWTICNHFDYWFWNEFC